MYSTWVGVGGVGWGGEGDGGVEEVTAIAALEARYRDETGVSSLKIRHNGVLGYFIEVPSKHADKLMAPDSGFSHRQTMANAMRYTTVELSELEGRILKAAERALAVEISLMDDLVRQVTAEAESVAGPPKP